MTVHRDFISEKDASTRGSTGTLHLHCMPLNFSHQHWDFDDKMEGDEIRSYRPRNFEVIVLHE
jgi:hypothetical protein